CRPFTVNPRRNRDRMCKCNTVTREDIPFAIWSGLRPDTPYQCVRAQCGFRGNHIEHVRTDTGCRGEALTRWQTEKPRG
ncbi:hypothetical protein SK432_25865, partial [Escherichia coli]|nr:hypothetical protein [Escherichia coli]